MSCEKKERLGEMIPEDLLATIKGASHLMLFTHYNPDGDAYGSLLGMAGVLQNLGKKVHCYLEEPVSYLYEFLPMTARASTSLVELEAFAKEAGDDLVAIALDCGDEERLGEHKEIFLQYAPFVVIDHHRGHKDFGTHRWIYDSCSSTGEMVYELALALDAPIDLATATNLYVAICTDTGYFRYESTSARTMAIAAELLVKGVKPEEIGSRLYENYTPERLRLLELALGTIRVLAGGRVSMMTVSQQMLGETGASMVDVDGFIDFARSLRTVKVAALLKEAPSGDVAISLRAKGECDVSAIAAKFGGGGHRNAAGFRCPGKKLDEVNTFLAPLLIEALPS